MAVVVANCRTDELPGEAVRSSTFAWYNEVVLDNGSGVGRVALLRSAFPGQ